MTMAFLQRGRSVPVAQMSAPQGADMGNSAQLSYPLAGGAVGETVAGIQASLQGRISLGLLSALVVGTVLFYLWTRDAQGS